ncbi:MAG: class I mannose-6-phosphate isomerase [Acetatifactor sp.]|nr:class I mannose-6-phosphate isomerase [Acetatifactor sp.]
MEEILFLNPGFSHTIWGGERLRTEYHYEEPGSDIGECWGISAHPTAESTVINGTFAGTKLSELWSEHKEVFGYAQGDVFPLLTKIIDAKADLSIQVHPDDVYAKEHENGALGKTECWYILDCPVDATLVIGHNASSQEELKDMIHNGKWKEFIREIPVKKGDFIQIDPGTVHAIKGGILLLETQQSSDITYRVYDYDRLQNGKPRQLHIEQSIDVITVPAASVENSIKAAAHLAENHMNLLHSCKYYDVYQLKVNGEFESRKIVPFMLASVTEGEGSINGSPVKKGDHMIFTAAMETISVKGQLELILSNS